MTSPFLAALNMGSTELLAIFAISLLVSIPILLLPAILSYILLNRIPVEHRKQEPGLAFLLVIPIFSMIWAFFVYPRIADSLQSYFGSKGEPAGDCGRSIALAACICAVCAIIPFVGMLAVLAALVLLIIFFVKAFELTGRIQKNVGGQPPSTIAPAGSH